MNSDIFNCLCSFVHEKYVIALINTCSTFYHALHYVPLKSSLPLRLQLCTRYVSVRRYLCLFKSRINLQRFESCTRLSLNIPMIKAHVQLASSLKHLHICFTSQRFFHYEIVGECALQTFKLISKKQHAFDIQWSNHFSLTFDNVNNIFHLQLPCTLHRLIIRASGEVNMQSAHHVPLKIVVLPHVKTFTWISTLKHVKVKCVGSFVGNPSSALKTLVITEGAVDVQFPDQLKKLILPKNYIYLKPEPLPSKLQCLKLKDCSNSIVLPHTIERLYVECLPKHLPSQLKHLTCSKLRHPFEIPQGLISMKTCDIYQINANSEYYNALRILKTGKNYCIRGSTIIPECIERLNVNYKICQGYTQLTHLITNCVHFNFKYLPHLRVLKIDTHDNELVCYSDTLYSLTIRNLKTILNLPETLKKLCIRKSFHPHYLRNLPSQLYKLKLVDQKNLLYHIILPETLKICIMPKYNMFTHVMALPSHIRKLTLMSMARHELKALIYLKTCKVQCICN